MDNFPAKPPVTIRHLIAAATEIDRKNQQRPLFLRARVPFKWKKNQRNSRDRKEERSRIFMIEREDESEDDEDEDSSDEFSDALSHAEACSLTVVSDINTVDEEQSISGISVSESQLLQQERAADTRNFMMDRFLPAATAMAHQPHHRHRHRHHHHASFEPSSKTRPLPLPRQSRPFLTKAPTRSSDDDDDDDDDDDEDARMQLKLACGGLFSWRFHYCRPFTFLFPRKKRTTKTQSYKLDEDDDDDDDDDDESSSGTDQERAVIIATRRKAWEARYKQHKLIMLACTPPSPSPSPNNIAFHSPIEQQQEQEQEQEQEQGKVKGKGKGKGKGFLGFPEDRGHCNSNIVKIKQEEYSVLPPPLPKSPSESWLWRAIPSFNHFNNNHSATIAMKIDRHDFDDAKWEI